MYWIANYYSRQLEIFYSRLCKIVNPHKNLALRLYVWLRGEQVIFTVSKLKLINGLPMIYVFVNPDIYLIKFFVASSLCECVLSCVYVFYFLSLYSNYNIWASPLGEVIWYWKEIETWRKRKRNFAWNRVEINRIHKICVCFMNQTGWWKRAFPHNF